MTVQNVPILYSKLLYKMGNYLHPIKFQIVQEVRKAW